MVDPKFEAGFDIWRSEAEELADTDRMPDEEVPIMALAGVYFSVASKLQKTIFDWRRTVMDSPEIIETLKLTVPYANTHLNDDLNIPMIEFDYNGLRRVSTELRFECDAVLHGTPQIVESISTAELFLARNIGRAANKRELIFNPFSLLPNGQATLGEFFPRSLAYIEGN